MDDVRVGRLLRALRIRRHLRQEDIGEIAEVSQSAISLIERGHLSTLSIRVLRAVFAAVDARFDGTVAWRGGALDRLLDERHARLVGQFAASLTRAGWEVQVEVTFAHYGERGSIDIVGLRPSDGVTLIVEIKTELTAIDDTIRRLDIKDRLGAQIVFERFGWRPTTVARVLVVLEGSTARRRVAAHDGTLRVAFPDRGPRLRAWLMRPVGRISGLRFVSLSG
ncbi:MAG: helix-turn-helix domain-containing protein [Candidatus Limnocylindrales bacterium]|nr:helix-turn-helix domain-containing protein [Candidatus Limnocylindrales bacterium]